jgi:hypothetical protein
VQSFGGHTCFHLTMASNINTYTHGYIFKPARSITSLDLLHVCDLLKVAFAAKHGKQPDEYLFEPEAICEGGIIFKRFPGMVDGQFKTMRLRFNQYPWLPEDLNEWRNKEPIEIHNVWNRKRVRLTRNNRDEYLEYLSEYEKQIKKQQVISTCLKAFKGAPHWTMEELKIFSSCLQQIGLKQSEKVKADDLVHC